MYIMKSFDLFYFAPFLYRKQQMIGKLRTHCVPRAPVREI